MAHVRVNVGDRQVSANYLLQQLHEAMLSEQPNQEQATKSAINASAAEDPKMNRIISEGSN